MGAVRRLAVLGGMVTVGALAGWGIERAWRRSPDPLGPEGLTLPEGKTRTVRTDDGAELAVTIAGRKRRGHSTIVLAHGWTNTRAVWAPVARQLVEAGHRVVLYDQRGHGESTLGSDVLSVPRFGDDLAAVLDQLDLKDAVLAGHSMGGFSIMAFACGHRDELQERVSRIVLVATAAHGLGLGRGDGKAAQLIASNALSWAMQRPRLGLFMVRGVVGQRPTQAHLVAARDMFVATSPEVRAGCYSAFGAMDLRDDLAKVETPTVVMVGSRDGLTPPRLGRAIAAAIPGASFELIPGAGHMLPLEVPDEVTAAILGN